MKTPAYICDECQNVFLEQDVCALIVTQPNLFENKFDYKATIPFKPGVKVENRPELYDIHFCLRCYAKCVTDPLKRINRRTEEGQKDYDYHFNMYRKNFYERLHRTRLYGNANHRRRN